MREGEREGRGAEMRENRERGRDEDEEEEEEELLAELLAVQGVNGGGERETGGGETVLSFS